VDSSFVGSIIFDLLVIVAVILVAILLHAPGGGSSCYFSSFSYYYQCLMWLHPPVVCLLDSHRELVYARLKSHGDDLFSCKLWQRPQRAAKKPNDGGASTSTIAAAAVVVLVCSTAIGRGDTPIDLYRSSLVRSNRIIITAPKTLCLCARRHNHKSSNQTVPRPNFCRTRARPYSITARSGKHE
jgi:hypothetical protein